MSKLIAGRTLEQWLESHPVLAQLMGSEETFWFNRHPRAVAATLAGLDIGQEDVQDAADRLDRFAPYISRVFPDTAERKGIIESPLICIPDMQDALSRYLGLPLAGRLMLKCDNDLPISGSVKARGGIYEVLKHAESLAVENGLLSPGDNYAGLDDKRFKEFFGRYSIAVGSTGNLGLSIGIMGAQLGFRVTVHMSADAKAWKKDRLRAKGVEVIEYDGDYGKAVAQGRKQAAADPLCHFVDDENSKDLFMGYAVAALRLKSQLADLGVKPDKDHPLFVYLPCGVGGAPGGISFGLKLVFGEHVHCIFAEPTRSPAMFLGVYTGMLDGVCVQDFGLDNVTDADGLACGRPSGFSAKRMKDLIDGFYTVSDATLFRQLALMADNEKIFMEPSALAGLSGMAHVLRTPDCLEGSGCANHPDRAVHIAWGTGGAMVPREIMDAYYLKGKSQAR
ncbi:MAG: D-serine ammonia-lyase [Desulfobacter sp.]|nr:MAG: D-serine ammonia-lyase [Desulfobacter sp.]